MLFLCWELSSPHQPHFIYPLPCLLPCRHHPSDSTSSVPGPAHNHPSLQGMFAADQHPTSSLPLTWGSPRCFQRLPAEHQCSQCSHGWDHRSSSCQSGATPQHCWGQEPRQNNGNHLQGRKLHLLDETLSSNKTCLDNSSFITRLFRC